MNALIELPREQKLDFNERSDGSPAWLSDALAQIDASTLWRYPDRSALEQTLARRFELRAEQLLVTNGGDEGIDLVLRTIAKKKWSLLLPLPAFSMYRVTAQRNDIAVTTIASLSEQRLNIDALVAAITSNQLIALTSPNNPSGEVISLTDARRIASAAQRVGSWLLFDAAYAEFNQADFSALLAREFDNVIVLRSFSKVYGMAALRVGYLMGCAALIDTIRALTPPFNVSAISLKLAQAALSEAAQQDQAQYVAAIQQNVERVRRRLLALGVAVNASAGNFILLPLSEKKAELLSQVLSEQHIRVRVFSEAELRGCVRITIPLDCSRLLSALESVLNPELICLDMDGVLIDTRDSYDNCVAETIVRLGGQAVSAATIQQKRNSGGFNDDWKLTQALLTDQNIECPLDDVIATFQSLYEGKNGYAQRETVLVSSVTAEQLRRKKTAVVTGRPANEALAGTHRLPWTVDALVSRDDVQQLKPDPEGIFSLQQRFKAQSSWMIGDSVDDMRAARAANAIAIGVGLHNQQALCDAGAHIVVNSINEVGELL